VSALGILGLASLFFVDMAFLWNGPLGRLVCAAWIRLYSCAFWVRVNSWFGSGLRIYDLMKRPRGFFML
jgi:hypothetical protein